VSELQKFREVGNSLVFRSVKRADKPFPFRKHWNAALIEAGIKDFRFHDLRHTCASYLAKENVPAIRIKEILGHSSLKSTERYVHLDTEENQQIVETVMNKYLRSADD
jgi:integrase